MAANPLVLLSSDKGHLCMTLPLLYETRYHKETYTSWPKGGGVGDITESVFIYSFRIGLCISSYVTFDSQV